MAESYFGIELKIVDPIFKNRILLDVLHKPTAYIQITDLNSDIYTLATCTSFSVTHDLNSVQEGFSCTIDAANIWNPRTTDYLNLLDIDIGKRIEIYYGQYLESGFQYIKIFTGILTENPESYSFGNSNEIRLSGKSLAYLLDRTDGSFTTATYSGGSKQLVEYWLNQAGFTYFSLPYTDTITFTDQTISYESAMTGIHAIRNVLGPLYDTYVSQDGVFIIKNTPEFTSGNIEFEYTESNILSFELSEDSGNVTTVAIVTGNSDTASSTKEASSTLLGRYGENKLTRNSGLITTADQADQLASDMLEYGALFQNVINLKVHLNPYLTGSSIISIESPTLMSLSEQVVKVESVNHSYTFGGDHTTTIKGLFS